MLRANTNHDRLTPNVAAAAHPTSAPRTLPSPRRRTEQDIGGTGGQFNDHTIPAGDPLPDVEEAMLLAELATSSRAHSPHGHVHVHHQFPPPVADKQTGPGPSLMDLTPDALQPHNSKMPETEESVQEWTKGLGRHAAYLGSRVRPSEQAALKAVNGKFAYPQGPIRRSEPKKEYPCTQCQRVFHSRSELRHHARRYEKRPYTCDQCEKSFLYPKDLRRHKTTHTGSKKYRCRICPKSFSRKDNLRRHINNEHDKTDVPLSPSIEAVEMPGRRGSEDSDDGGPKNGNAHYGYNDANGIGANAQNSYSMPTDVAEHSGTGTGSAGDAAGAGGGGTSHGSYHGRRAQDVTHEYNATEIFAIKYGEDEEAAGDDEPIDGDDGYGSISHYTFTSPSETARATSGPPRFSNSRKDTARRDEVVEAIDNDDETDIVDRISRKMVCPLTRWKPNVHKCRKAFQTIRKLIHHLKQKHGVLFHAQCDRFFQNDDLLQAHLNGGTCCRKCKRGFDSTQAFENHRTTSGCTKSSRTSAESWQMIYKQYCNDGLLHRPWEGEDYDAMEALARQRYPADSEIDLTLASWPPLSHLELPLPMIQPDQEYETEVLANEDTQELEDDAMSSISRKEWESLKAENTWLKARVSDLEEQAQATPNLLAQSYNDTATIADLKMLNDDLRARVEQLQQTLQLEQIQTPIQSLNTILPFQGPPEPQLHAPIPFSFSANIMYTQPQTPYGDTTNYTPGIAASFGPPGPSGPNDFSRESMQPFTMSSTFPTYPNIHESLVLNMSPYRQPGFPRPQGSKRSSEPDYSNSQRPSKRRTSVNTTYSENLVSRPETTLSRPRIRSRGSARNPSLGGHSLPALGSGATVTSGSVQTAIPLLENPGQGPDIILQPSSPCVGAIHDQFLEYQIQQGLEESRKAVATQGTADDSESTPKQTQEAVRIPSPVDLSTAAGSQGSEELTAYTGQGFDVVDHSPLYAASVFNEDLAGWDELSNWES